MADAPVFVATRQPWHDSPCHSEDNEGKEAPVNKHAQCVLSVPISPGSRLYERSFSKEMKRSSVSSHAVLQCGGLVLGNGNEELKHEVYSEEIDAEKPWDFFISHNWSVKRWKKFLALCLVWSGKNALICCFLVQIVCFTLVSTGVLPVKISQLDGHEISIWCISGSLVTYLAVFLVRHEVLDFFGIPGYRIFLDKVCVDQSDAGRKREGIQSITAYLYHSEALVVLYSELYLKRLWTVFELTTFLAMKPEGELVVQPVILGPVAVYFVFIQSLRIPEVFLMPTWDGLAELDWSSALGAYAVIAIDLISLFCGAVFLRMWGRTRADMARQISGFSFDHAECHHEADRLEILGAIKALARREGLVPANASTQLCTQSFERLVRELVPQRMDGAFRFTGITCQIACLMTLPSMALLLDVSAVRLRNLQDGDGSKEVIQDAVFELLMPICIGLCGIITGIRSTGSQLREIGVIFGGFLVLVAGVWIPGWSLMPHLVSQVPGTDGTRSLVLVFILALQCVLLLVLFRVRSCQCMTTRADGASADGASAA